MLGGRDKCRAVNVLTVGDPPCFFLQSTLAHLHCSVSIFRVLRRYFHHRLRQTRPTACTHLASFKPGVQLPSAPRAMRGGPYTNNPPYPKQMYCTLKTLDPDVPLQQYAILPAPAVR